MKYVDFHIHSRASDGTWSPEEVIEHVKKAEIGCFAVTDHDSVGSISKLNTLTRREELEYITGVELSSNWMGVEHHILAYNFSLDNPIIMRRINKNEGVRMNYHHELIRLLMKKYPEVSYEEFLEYEDDTSRGGWISLNYLLDKKVVGNMFEFFSVSEESGVRHDFDSPREIIEDIRNAGATSILAHPPNYHKSGIMPLDELKKWLDFGIEGLECYSPYYKQSDDSTYYTSFCKSHGLWISGGSDCHGTFVPSRRLRQPTILRSQVNLPFLKKDEAL